ncbi:MAG: hypothetical protein [Myoviridae sp. ctThM1]|nr:MAG: hypothetical protein [Myoviridae sp. ctThM1]
MKVEIKNTQDIQQFSVDAFLIELGYKRTVDGKRYEFMYPVKTGERFVSMRTAIELHNSQWLYDEISKLYYPSIFFRGVKMEYFRIPNVDSVFKLSPYEYEKSQARKIVCRCSLQQDKHGRMKVQSHLVQFMSEFYYEQFLETSEEVSGEE